MVALQPFQKARSLKHCCQLADDKEVSVERKYDGEYCQIHVWMAGGGSRITIFSKSGRDSTVDREGLPDIIRQCLAIVLQAANLSDNASLQENYWSGTTARVVSCRSTRSVGMFPGKGANWDAVGIHPLARMNI
jgi:hypothetical protein